MTMLTKTQLILALLILSYTAINAQGDLSNITFKQEHYTLANGIQVVLLPDTTQADVSVEFWIKAGARDERPGMFGFAHFFEHATPYGLSKDTAALNLMGKYRTNSNAQTKEDYTRYFVQVRPQALEVTLRYSAERFKADTAAITKRIIEYHRKNVLDEMNRQEANPMYGPTGSHARAIATFGSAHPYGHATYGTFDELKTFNEMQVKEWYTANFYPKNTLLFVVGNFNPVVAKLIIERQFGSIVGSKEPGTSLKHPNAVAGGSFTLPSSSPEHLLTLTWAVPGFGSAYDPALYLLAYIADRRLTKQQPSFIHKTGALELFNLYQFAGQFGLQASFKNIEDSTKAESYLQSVITDIAEHGVTQAEIETARKRVIDDITSYCKNLGFEGSRTELIGEGLLFANNANYYINRIEKQAKLNSKDIRKAASKWLMTKPGKVLVVAGQK